MLRSDFAMTLTERNRRVGYRDTFEVDGVPVRDRDERLQALLAHRVSRAEHPTYANFRQFETSARMVPASRGRASVDP